MWGWQVHTTDLNAVDVWVLREKVQYMIMADEIAPTTGMAHIQGYVYFKTARTITSVVRLLKKMKDSPPWVSIARGTAAENKEYCSKTDPMPLEYGELPVQGKRADLDEIRDRVVVQREPVRKLVMDGKIVNVQQLGFAERLQKYQSQGVRELPVVHWYWGPTGSGKTREAVRILQAECPDDWCIIEPPYDFMDPYQGHTGVLFDDVRPGSGSAAFAWWLRVLDRYPFYCNVKHGGVWWRANVIVITAPSAPAEFAAAWDQEQEMQLLRRITLVREFAAAPARETSPEV